MTLGRFYFSPPGTPFIERFNPFVSGNWMRGDSAWTPTIGENPTSPRAWDNGAWDGPRPLPIVVGDANELERGCTGQAPADVYLVSGVDSRCFPTPPTFNLSTFDDWDITSMAVLRLLAQLLEWSYTDPGAASTFFSFWLGATVSVDVVANSNSLYPGTIIVRHPNWTLLVISGTSNPQQLAAQAAYNIAGPVDVGPYSTLPLWHSASNVVLDRLTASGADPNTPILVVGHSYGGAVASLVAARLHQGIPARPVRLVTMGSPAPGDVRVQLMLRGVQQVHLSTLNDPIVQLPLQGANLYGLQLLMPAPLLAAWSRWRQAAPTMLVDGSPALTPLPLNGLTFTLLRQIALAVVGQRPLSRFTEHDIAEYLRLLGLSSPQPLTFPMPAPVKAMLLPSPLLSINVVVGLTAGIGP